MDNWNKLKQPPKWALRTIGSGSRIKGMTDIKPQWRYQVMTEVYGECGVGWKYEIARTWTEPGPEGQMFVFAEINIYTSHEDGWSDPVPGVGGDMLIKKEKAGLYCNDEAFKMAITDALGGAMKMLGVAADIYAGMWDGSKYKVKPEEAKPTKIDLDAIQKEVDACKTEQALGNLMKMKKKDFNKSSNKDDAVALFSARKEQIQKSGPITPALKETIQKELTACKTTEDINTLFKSYTFAGDDPERDNILEMFDFRKSQLEA